MEYLKVMSANLVGTVLGLLLYTLCWYGFNSTSPSGAKVPAYRTLVYEVQDQYMYREIKERLPQEPPKCKGNRVTGVMRI